MNISINRVILHVYDVRSKWKKWANKLTVQNLKWNVSKQVYPVCYSCCLGVTSCCLLVVKMKMNGMAATRVKGMASMRVTAKRAKGDYYIYVV